MQSKLAPSTPRATSKSPWINSENESFLRICEKNPRQWKKVAEEFNLVTKSPKKYTREQCSSRFNTLGTLPKRWSPEEDEKLKDEVLKASANGKISWPLIAKQFPDRTNKQCRERYNGFLHNTVDSSPLNDRELTLLLEGHLKLKGKWAKIRKTMYPASYEGPKKTADRLKNFWTTLKNTVPEFDLENCSYDTDTIPVIVRSFRSRQPTSTPRHSYRKRLSTPSTSHTPTSSLGDSFDFSQVDEPEDSRNQSSDTHHLYRSMSSTSLYESIIGFGNDSSDRKRSPLFPDIDGDESTVLDVLESPRNFLLGSPISPVKNRFESNVPSSFECPSSVGSINFDIEKEFNDTSSIDVRDQILKKAMAAFDESCPENGA